MNNDIGQPNKPRNGKALAGIILLFVGMVLLVQQFNFFFIPSFLFSWPMLLIGIGLYIGAKSNFNKPTAFVLILLGVVFLIKDNIDGSGHIIWPLAIISFGLWMILRKNHRFDKDYADKRDKYDWRKYTDFDPTAPVVDYTQTEVPPNAGTNFNQPTGDDYLDTVSIFGGINKSILSKNFRGGDIVNIFGGSELDFTQANINGRVIIDITQIFGSTKIIVPSNWQVVADISAVFAGIDDKRIKSTASVGTEKILVLKGVSIFAGIDIRSF